MIFEICAVIITLVWVVLGVYLVMTLQTLRASLRKIEPLSEEASKLLQQTQDLTSTVNSQMQSFNPLLKSISDVGCAVERMTCSLNEEQDHTRVYVEEKKSARKSKIEDLIELVARGALLLFQLKKRR